MYRNWIGDYWYILPRRYKLWWIQQAVPTRLLEPKKPLAPGLHKMGASKFYTFGLILLILASTLLSVFKILHSIEAQQTFVYESACVCKILA